MRKCEIKYIKKHKKVEQEISLPLNSLVTFCLTLNVKSISYTHNVLLQSLLLCSKPACSTENELVQPSLSNEQGPAGLPRMALRSAPPMEVRGKLHYMQFSRRKWSWTSLFHFRQAQLVQKIWSSTWEKPWICSGWKVNTCCCEICLNGCDQRV